MHVKQQTKPRIVNRQ